MNEVNEKLIEIYENEKETVNAFAKKCSEVVENIKSYAYQLACATDDYLKAPVKVMYIGKENNGWEYGTDADVETSLKYTINFHMNEAYNKPFFLYAKDLACALNSGIEYKTIKAITWSNLLKLSINDKGKSAYLRNKHSDLYNSYLKESSTLKNEISILKPDVVVFTTGPTYDNFLKMVFNGLKYEAVCEQFNKRQFAKLSHDCLPVHTYRVYHPDYANRKKQMLWQPIINKITELYNADK